MKFCNQENLAKIDAYIQKNKERILDDLFTLIRIPSVQGEAKPGAPFGDSCAKMLEETTAMYERHGFRGRINQEGGYAISYYGEEKEKVIGLFCHGDVVPATGEWLVCPPFDPIIKDNYIFGRGCNDDKSGILESLYAAEIIRELGFDLKSQLLMFTGVNEETGMADIAAYVEQEIMPEASLILDGEYPCYCGERGILRFQLVSKKKLDMIQCIRGGQASNIILGEVTAEITYNEILWEQIQSACKDDPRFLVSKAGELITILAKGIPSHMVHAEHSLNAAKLLAEMLLTCDALSANDLQLLEDVKALLGDAYGTGLGIAHDDPAFGKLLCGNGIVKTTPDGKLEIFFDVRAGLSYPLADISAQIQSQTAAHWDYCETRRADGRFMPEDAPLRILVEKTYAAVSGITDAKSILTAGGTHARKLHNALPIGTVGYYKASPIDLPQGHGGVHQPDEKMSVDGFLEAIKILVCMIMELDAMLHG